MDARCETCRWWDGDARNDGFGKCRRYAPRPYSNFDIDRADPSDEPAWWPITDHDDYCGEHEPRGGGDEG